MDNYERQKLEELLKLVQSVHAERPDRRLAVTLTSLGSMLKSKTESGESEGSNSFYSLDAVATATLLQKKAIDEALETKERLTIAISAVKFGVWDWDLKAGVLIWDDYMYELFDVRKEDFNGAYDAFEKTLLASDAAQLNSELQVAFAARRALFESEFRVRSTDGSIKNIKAAGKCFYHDDGSIWKVIGVNWDETHRKRAEAALVASAKMASLGEMAGGIAHEINNPLAVISAKAFQLKEKVGAGRILPEEFEKQLGRIEFNAERISKIIKGLRAFSRNSEADPMEIVRASQIVGDTVELCEQRFKHHSIALRVNLKTDASIVCRPSQISQVLMNLLGNAFDAVWKTPESWVSLDLELNEETVVVRVTDSGPGIPAVILEKIMQPFFTTKAVGSGTGLGLSISQGICENHRGTLRYNGASTHTQFIVEIPLTQTVADSLDRGEAA